NRSPRATQLSHCRIRTRWSPHMSQEEGKRRAARAAMQFVEPGMIVGVGTGSTVAHFIDALAERRGLIEAAVSSSEQSTRLLKERGIAVVDLNSTGELALYVDGADECDPDRCLIKGGGAALTREKIIAAASRQFVCIIDPSKRVDVLAGFPCPWKSSRWRAVTWRASSSCSAASRSGGTAWLPI